MKTARAVLIWLAVGLAILIPISLAVSSPLLQWRQPVYIAAGLAGIVGFAAMLVQPLLAIGYLPGLSRRTARRLHRAVGTTLVLAILVHVGGLWITSPPDVIDALLLVSPTPFSIWGVAAMWAILAAALLAAFRRRLRWASWRHAHLFLAAVSVAATVVHALLIQGTMETLSKIALCALVVSVTLKALLTRRGAR